MPAITSKQTLVGRTALAAVATALCGAVAVSAQVGAPVPQWTSGGPESAFIISLGVDPLRPQIAFAGTAGLGLHRSRDAGRSWQRVGPELPTRNHTAVYVDPANPNTVLLGISRTGLFRSDDGGDSWMSANISATLPQVTTVQSITSDPRNPQVIFLGTQFDGIFRSDDHGATWVAKNDGISLRRANVVLPDPHRAARVYAAIQSLGVMRSDDNGDSWTDISTGLTNRAVSSLAIDPIDERILYAGTSRGVFKTTDGGALWVETNLGLNHLAVTALLIDPRDPSTLYAGTVRGGVYRSSNAGGTWFQVNQGMISNPIIQAMVSSSAGALRIYVGTAGQGVFSYASECLGPFPGDCNGDGVVTVDEILVGLNIALGFESLTQCPQFDTNGDGQVTVNELLAALDAALGGCPVL